MIVKLGFMSCTANFLVAAADVSHVKRVMEDKDIFKKKNMHIDAVQEIEVVDGCTVTLIEDQPGITSLINYDYTQIKQLA